MSYTMMVTSRAQGRSSAKVDFSLGRPPLALDGSIPI